MIGARNLTIRLAICSFLPALVSTATGATLYVNTDGSGGAYTSIQEAIDDAYPGDQIEVAPGTYHEAINFNGLAIRLYSTSGPGATIIDANDLVNVYHVVQCVMDEGPGTILEGFTITGGNANGASSPDDLGAGMYNSNSSPTVTNCTFSGNLADWAGGGMFNDGSSPTVSNCTFSGNAAGWGGGMENYGSSPTVSNCAFSGNAAGAGGGMDNDNSSPTVTNCTFSGNAAPFWEGGGMYNYSSSPTVTNCTFSGNSADAGAGVSNSNSSPTLTNCTFSGNSAGGGGGIHNDSSSPTVTNCTFADNSAIYGGGGMYNFGGSPTVSNCTFSGNSAVSGGGMLNVKNSPIVTNCTFSGNSALTGGGMDNSYGATVTNCILWSDYGGEIYGSATVAYSDIQIDGGWPGTGNIAADPCFIGGGDYHLQADSPCIDTGDSSAVPGEIATDLDGNPRIVGAAVDMGAFEAQPPTLVEATGLLITEQAEEGHLDSELEGPLLAKVDAARAALDRGNPNDAKVAMNDLKALINQVEAQAGKKITPEAAAVIIAAANAIIASLGG